MKNITLEEIIRRKLAYIKNNPDSELRDVDEGYIRGFSDMLADIDLSEADFVAKYLKAVNDHRDIIDSVMDGETAIPNFGNASGYSNAVLEILSLIDTKYMFEA